VTSHRRRRSIVSASQSKKKKILTRRPRKGSSAKSYNKYDSFGLYLTQVPWYKKVQHGSKISAMRKMPRQEDEDLLVREFLAEPPVSFIMVRSKISPSNDCPVSGKRKCPTGPMMSDLETMRPGKPSCELNLNRSGQTVP
jgi:hypothetical protein